jgi:uncharacterized membrane protein YcaP (DUF421 family)
MVMFFHDWHSILRIAVISAVTYVLVIGVLRLLGEEALAKMSAYDLLVTVALGSLLASIPLGAGLTIADGLAAIITYLVLQQIMRWTIKRSKRAEQVVRDIPKIMVWDGQFIEKHMRESSILEGEVRAAVRRSGISSISRVLAVILENDGDWSIIPYDDGSDLSALEGLDKPWPLSTRGSSGRGQSHPHQGGLPVADSGGTI